MPSSFLKVDLVMVKERVKRWENGVWEGWWPSSSKFNSIIARYIPHKCGNTKTISKVYQTEESQGTQSTWSFSLAGIISKALISQCLEYLTKFYMETVKLQTLLRPASTSLVLVLAHCWLCKPWLCETKALFPHRTLKGLWSY